MVNPSIKNIIDRLNNLEKKISNLESKNMNSVNIEQSQQNSIKNETILPLDDVLKLNHDKITLKPFMADCALFKGKVDQIFNQDEVNNLSEKYESSYLLGK